MTRIYRKNSIVYHISNNNKNNFLNYLNKNKKNNKRNNIQYLYDILYCGELF